MKLKILALSLLCAITADSAAQASENDETLLSFTNMSSIYVDLEVQTCEIAKDANFTIPVIKGLVKVAPEKTYEFKTADLLPEYIVNGKSIIDDFKIIICSRSGPVLTWKSTLSGKSVKFVYNEEYDRYELKK